MDTVFTIFCALVVPLFFFYQPADARSYLLAAAGAAYVLVRVITDAAATGSVVYSLRAPDAYLAAFFIVAAGSVLWAQNRRTAATDVMYWLGCLSLYFAARSVAPAVLFLALYAPAAAMVPIVIYQAYIKKRYGEIIQHNGISLIAIAGGVFGNTNFLGNYLVVVFFAGAWLIGHGYFTAWHWILQALIGICILLSKCRSAWTAMCAGAAIFACLHGHPWVLLPAAGIALACIATRLYHIRGQAVIDNSSKARLAFLINALNLIRHRPVLGWGLRSYRIEQFYSFRDVGKSSEWARQKASGMTDRVHNDYLEIAVETGLVGITLFICFLAALPWQTADPESK